MFSRDSKYPNLLIRSAEGTPEWVPAMDGLLLSCGNSNFSCCERNHVSTTATDEAKGVKINQPIPCDKPVVHGILTTLLDKKVLQFKDNEQLTLARCFRCMRQWWLRDLLVNEGDEETKKVVRPENAVNVHFFFENLNSCFVFLFPAEIVRNANCCY